MKRTSISRRGAGDKIAAKVNIKETSVVDPELLIRIQQKIEEQMNKNLISHSRPVNSGPCTEGLKYEIDNGR